MFSTTKNMSVIVPALQIILGLFGLIRYLCLSECMNGPGCRAFINFLTTSEVFRNQLKELNTKMLNETME